MDINISKKHVASIFKVNVGYKGGYKENNQSDPRKREMKQ
jgi:hypothetical protein